ncbi:MAG: hypothetical protein IJ194_03370 [Bacilli bacterium]|nr:hypothetical protein [Bacilli bacterium]
MIDENLFKRDTFLLEESDPLTICISFDYNRDDNSKRVVKEITPEMQKKLNGGAPIWEELDRSYSVKIYAMSHNNVYLTVYEQVAETAFKRIENIILNKFHPQWCGFLGEGDHQFVYCFFIKELGGLKRGIII